MDIEDKIDVWLKEYTLEEILEQNDLTVEDVLLILYRSGNIALPDWLEDEIEEYHEL